VQEQGDQGQSSPWANIGARLDDLTHRHRSRHTTGGRRAERGGQDGANVDGQATGVDLSQSNVSLAATGVICGLGPFGYEAALAFLAKRLRTDLSRN